MTRLRDVRAGNVSAMTLDGTRTWLVGEREVAVIDAGPDLADHVSAVERAVAGARVVAILLTHDHPDHAGGAPALAARLPAPVLSLALGNLDEGDVVATDAGDLLALRTPGHTRDHLAFHLPSKHAIFCGDLMLGGQSTALVSPPEGDLADYLASLARLRALEPVAIHPAHGPSFDDPAHAIDAYIAHREQRLAQVMAVLDDGHSHSSNAIREAVYEGTIPAALRDIATGATLAYLRYLERSGRVAERRGLWRKL